MCACCMHCIHQHLNTSHVFHASRLSPYIGTPSDAKHIGTPSLIATSTSSKQFLPTKVIGNPHLPWPSSFIGKATTIPQTPGSPGKPSAKRMPYTHTFVPITSASTYLFNIVTETHRINQSTYKRAIFLRVNQLPYFENMTLPLHLLRVN